MERNITPSEFSAFRTISPPNANSISPPPPTPNSDFDIFPPFNLGEDATFIATITIKNGEIFQMEPEPNLSNFNFFKKYGNRIEPAVSALQLPSGRKLIVFHDDPILPTEVQF